MPIALLSKMPGAGSQAVASDPATRSVEHQLLPRRLHPAPRTEPTRTDFTQTTARAALRCQFPDLARSRRRSQTPGRRDRLLIHPAHLGIQPAAPLPYTRSRPRRRTVSRPSALDPHHSSDVPAAGSRSAHRLPQEVPRRPSKVTKHKVGDKVGVGCFVDSCRTCVECQRGLEQYCSVQTVWTYNGRDKEGTPTYGGYSDKIVVDENYVLRMPNNLPLDACAPLLCAGITLYSPLRHWQAGPGKKVAIVGLGGLGHMGVKLAHALGSEVTEAND